MTSSNIRTSGFSREAKLASATTMGPSRFTLEKLKYDRLVCLVCSQHFGISKAALVCNPRKCHSMVQFHESMQRKALAATSKGPFTRSNCTVAKSLGVESLGFLSRRAEKEAWRSSPNKNSPSPNYSSIVAGTNARHRSYFGDSLPENNSNKDGSSRHNIWSFKFHEMIGRFQFSTLLLPDAKAAIGTCPSLPNDESNPT